MKKVLFIYRHNELSNIFSKSNNIIGPDDFLFGLNHFKNNKKFSVNFINVPRARREKFIEKASFFLIERHFNKAVKLGLPVEIYPLYKKEIDEADVIFCENDPVSFAILFWKKLGFIKADVVCMIQSLPERIKYFKKSKIFRYFIRALLSEAKVVLTLSKFVHKELISEFKVAKEKLDVLYFGVSKSFWKNTNLNEDDFILSVGNDMNRDYETLVEALPNNIKLKIVTRKEIELLGKNIVLLRDISNEELRKLYSQCKFAVIPSIKLQNESSGLSSCLQLMSCKKAVIISRIPTLQEIFKDEKDCLFFEAENSKDLRKKIELLIKNNDLRNEIALKGYENAKKFSSNRMKNKLETIFEKLLK